MNDAKQGTNSNRPFQQYSFSLRAANWDHMRESAKVAVPRSELGGTARLTLVAVRSLRACCSAAKETTTLLKRSRYKGCAKVLAYLFCQRLVMIT
eukprot:6203448-Pleurochrysis_carterae.AAC.1